MRHTKLIIFIPAILFILSGCDSQEKREFINSCKLSIRNSDACECSWDKMTKKHEPKQLKDIGEGRIRAPAGFQQEMAGIMQQCLIK
ncbi:MULTISPECIES: hypothetical protein [Serratia]|uniref:hypothetical protein n=1 Tax=Serratia TaxID=613 RepID=UPI00094976B8|nr:hypothetical protein [Serratia sp. 506_PEND]